MTWLHTWTGLVLSWVLFFMFLTGTLGYLDTEIDRWMTPEIPYQPVSTEHAAELAMEYSQKTMPDAKSWWIDLPNERNGASVGVYLSSQDKSEEYSEARLNTSTGEKIQLRDTGGGQTLYKMHYKLHYLPKIIAYYLVGICTMLMLVGIITGIIIHKKIFREFFTFRKNKGPLSWLDIHNLFSVSALPFHLMITYSGLIFFTFTFMPATVGHHYGFSSKNIDKIYNEIHAHDPDPIRSGIAAPLTDIQPVIIDVLKRWNGSEIAYVQVHLPGDKNAEFHFSERDRSPVEAPRHLTYSASTGSFINASPETRPAALVFGETMTALHEGLFAGPGLRALYLLSGLLGTAMIGAGLILWTLKRRSKELTKASGPSVGYRIVESLNIGTVIGLPCAIAIYFWANRLLPANIEDRASWEVNAMFIAWVITILHAFIRTKAHSWIEQLWLGAALFGLLPILNAITTERGFINSALTNDWLYIGFDLTSLIIAVIFASTARYMRARLNHLTLKRNIKNLDQKLVTS